MCSILVSANTKWQLLADEVSHYMDRGSIVLMGDFNARTADKRNCCSKDLKTNDYGRLLMDIYAR